MVKKKLKKANFTEREGRKAMSLNTIISVQDCQVARFCSRSRGEKNGVSSYEETIKSMDRTNRHHD